MTSTGRQTKRRRLKKEEETNSEFTNECSETSNTTVFDRSKHQPTTSQHHYYLSEDEAISVYPQAQPSTEKTHCLETKEDRGKRNSQSGKDSRVEMPVSNSSCWESDCVSMWVEETSCLSVNGPVEQDVKISEVRKMEQEEVTSLPTAEMLCQHLRTSLKLVHETLVQEVDEKSTCSLSSLSDHGKDAFADEEWDINGQFVRCPYKQELDFEE